MDGKQTSISASDAAVIVNAAELREPHLPEGWLGFPDKAGFWWAKQRHSRTLCVVATFVFGSTTFIQFPGSQTEHFVDGYVSGPSWIFKRIIEPADVPEAW